MKEISDILQAYDIAKQQGKKTALATVVKVEGSSYRRPGARMLVTEDGVLTGAVSGGCLEGDALKKALLAIHQQKNKVITYDTSLESESEFGVQLGCNGIVHILFEAIDASDEKNPMELLRTIKSQRRNAVVVCIFSENRHDIQPGTVAVQMEKEYSSDLGNFLKDENLLAEIIHNKKSFVQTVFFQGKEMLCLYDFIPLNISVVIAGAGNDVKPLVTICKLLGWDVHVRDGRRQQAVLQRFPEANSVETKSAEDFLENIEINNSTYFLLMTHNFRYDLHVLQQLLAKDAHYIGILGPKSKLEKMYEELQKNGIYVSENQKKKIFGPVGLDIGAETSEEIALSIVSEIKAVVEKRNGKSLKYKLEKIHCN